MTQGGTQRATAGTGTRLRRMHLSSEAQKIESQIYVRLEERGRSCKFAPPRGAGAELQICTRLEERGRGCKFSTPVKQGTGGRFCMRLEERGRNCKVKCYRSSSLFAERRLEAPAAIARGSKPPKKFAVVPPFKAVNFVLLSGSQRALRRRVP